MGVEGEIFLGVVRRRGRGGGVIFIEYNEIMENKKFGSHPSLDAALY